jgi:Heterokaryon incompatibility protein (HET)
MSILFLTRPRASSRFVSLKRQTHIFNRPRDAFKYTPLDVKANEIRLLTVLPRRWDTPGVLHCSLRNHTLNPRLEYHGLSYAWKDISLDENDRNEKIVVNDSWMVVGRNLAAALRARQSHEFCSIPLWVDALCINQDDTAERNAQILRMHDIYAQASLVAVWLGPEQDGSALALDFIREISADSRQLEGWVQSMNSALVRDSSLFMGVLSGGLTRRVNTPKWHALHKLLQRSWWKRMWIVQETVAAKQLMFFCGSKTLDTQDLTQFLDALSKSAAMYVPLLSLIEGIVLDYDTFSLARAYLRPTTWSTISLLQALYRTGMALCTDPRDKIFAVLNLAYDGAKIVPNPDYTIPVDQVYKQLAVSLIKETGRLDILSLANLPVYPRQLDMPVPSWVPDWTFRVTSTINSRIAAVRKVWADKGSIAVANFSDDNNALMVKGFIVDTIDGLAMCSSKVEPSISNPQLHQSKSHKSRYDGIEILKAICQSLLANRPLPPGDWFPDSLSLFLQQCRELPKEVISSPHTCASKYSAFKEWYINNNSLIVAGRTTYEWVNDLSLPGLKPIATVFDSVRNPDFFDFNLLSHTQSWRFFTTTSGYAGLGPNPCQPGDKIVIIFGCASPLVLRPIGSHYELVGECYVHGIMHGEAMRDPLNRESETVVAFEIR